MCLWFYIKYIKCFSSFVLCLINDYATTLRITINTLPSKRICISLRCLSLMKLVLSSIVHPFSGCFFWVFTPNANTLRFLAKACGHNFHPILYLPFSYTLSQMAVQPLYRFQKVLKYLLWFKKARHCDVCESHKHLSVDLFCEQQGHLSLHWASACNTICSWCVFRGQGNSLTCKWR